MYEFIYRFSLKMLEKYDNKRNIFAKNLYKFYDKLYTWSFYKEYGYSRYEAIDEHDAYLDREESRYA
jgi:hypothetical protein